MSQSVPQQVKSLLVTNVIVFISVKMTFIFENWVNMKSFRRSQAWVNNIKHKHVPHWYYTGTDQLICSFWIEIEHNSQFSVTAQK